MRDFYDSHTYPQDIKPNRWDSPTPVPASPLPDPPPGPPSGDDTVTPLHLGGEFYVPNPVETVKNLPRSTYEAVKGFYQLLRPPDFLLEDTLFGPIQRLTESLHGLGAKDGDIFTEEQRAVGTLASEFAQYSYNVTTKNPYDIGEFNQYLSQDALEEQFPTLTAAGQEIERLSPISLQGEWQGTGALAQHFQDNPGELFLDLAISATGLGLASKLGRTSLRAARRAVDPLSDLPNTLNNIDFLTNTVSPTRRLQEATVQLDVFGERQWNLRNLSQFGQREYLQSGKGFRVGDEIVTASHVAVGHQGITIDPQLIRATTARGVSANVQAARFMPQADLAALAIPDIRGLRSIDLDTQAINQLTSIDDRTGAVLPQTFSKQDASLGFMTNTYTAGESGMGLVTESGDIGGLYLGTLGGQGIFTPAETIQKFLQTDTPRFNISDLDTAPLRQQLITEGLHYKFAQLNPDFRLHSGRDPFDDINDWNDIDDFDEPQPQNPQKVRYASEHILQPQHFQQASERGYLTGTTGRYKGLLYLSEGAHYRGREPNAHSGFFFDPIDLEQNFEAIPSSNRIEDVLYESFDNPERDIPSLVKQIVPPIARFENQIQNRANIDPTTITPTQIQNILRKEQFGLEDLLKYQREYKVDWAEPEMITAQDIPLSRAIGVANETGTFWINPRTRSNTPADWELIPTQPHELGGLEPGSFSDQGMQGVQSLIIPDDLRLHSGKRYISEHIMTEEHYRKAVGHGVLNSQIGDYAGSLFFSEGTHIRRIKEESAYGFLFDPNMLEKDYGGTSSDWRMGGLFKSLEKELSDIGEEKQSLLLNKVPGVQDISKRWESVTGIPSIPKSVEELSLSDHFRGMSELKEKIGVNLEWINKQEDRLGVDTIKEFIVMEDIPIERAVGVVEAGKPRMFSPGQEGIPFRDRKLEDIDIDYKTSIPLPAETLRGRKAQQLDFSEDAPQDIFEDIPANLFDAAPTPTPTPEPTPRTARIRNIDQFTGSLRKDIWQFKDDITDLSTRAAYARRFGRFISENLPEDFNMADYDRILAMPAKQSSLDKRGGFNPAQEMARAFGIETQTPVVTDVLSDLSNVSVKEMSKVQRQSIGTERFRVDRPDQITGKRILLFDDTQTTGATAKNALQAIGTADPAQVDILTMAARPWFDKGANIKERMLDEGIYRAWKDNDFDRLPAWQHQDTKLALPAPNPYPPTPSQQAALQHTYGPAITLAGPGSGKTQTLIGRMKYLNEQNLATPDDILTLVFGKKAEQDLSRRAGDAWNISTIDAFSRRIVRENYESLGYSAAPDITTQSFENWLPTATKQLKAQGIETVPLTQQKTVQEWATQYEDTRTAQLGGKEDYSSLPEPVQTAINIFRREKLKANKIDFTDATLQASYLLEQNAGVRKRLQTQYPFVQIDEFQDVSPIQNRLLSNLSDNLWAVGDLDQSIMSFRGGGGDVMTDTIRQGASLYNITENFRSTPEIVNAAQHFINQNAGRMPLGQTSIQPSGAPINLIESADNQATDIDTLINQIGRDRETAILTRTQRERDTLRDRINPTLRRQGWSEEELTNISYSTIHAAKGKEFQDVILPLNLLDKKGAVDKTFPSRHARTAAELAEEERLLYVAITRAEKNFTMIARDDHPYMRTISEGLNQQLQPKTLDYFEDVGVPDIIPPNPLDQSTGNFRRIVLEPDKQWGDADPNLNAHRPLYKLMSELKPPPFHEELISGTRRIESWFTPQGWDDFGQRIYDRAKELNFNPTILRSDKLDPIAYMDEHQVIKEMPLIPGELEAQRKLEAFESMETPRELEKERRIAAAEAERRHPTSVKPAIPDEIAAASTKAPSELKATLQTVFASPSNLFNYIRGGESRLARLRAERDARLNVMPADNLKLHSGREQQVGQFLNQVNEHPNLFYRFANPLDIDQPFSQDLTQTVKIGNALNEPELPLPDSFFKQGDAPFGEGIYDPRPLAQKLAGQPTEKQLLTGAVYRRGLYGHPTTRSLSDRDIHPLHLFRTEEPRIDFDEGRELRVYFGAGTPYQHHLGALENVFLPLGVVDSFPTNIPLGSRFEISPRQGEYIETGHHDFTQLNQEIKQLPDIDSTRLWKEHLTTPGSKSLYRQGLEDILNPQLQLHSGILQPGDPNYPIGISQAFKSPRPLHYSGNTSLLRQGLPRIAVVGRATDPTVHELAIAGATGTLLAQQDRITVSGFARGTDQAAQLAALQAGGQSISVLPHGLDAGFKIPPEFQQFIDSDKLLRITPFEPSAHFTGRRAMTRNAYTTAVSDATVVIGSDPLHRPGSTKYSGTFQTAQNALRQKRPLFIIDPSLYPDAPEGNQLLIEMGGTPITDLAQIPELISDVPQLQAPQQLDLFLHSNKRTLYHATPKSNVLSIMERGLDPTQAQGKRQETYLHSPSRRQWAIEHTMQKNKIPRDDVALFEVEVDRKNLVRRWRGIWSTPEAIQDPRLLDLHSQLAAQSPYHQYSTDSQSVAPIIPLTQDQDNTQDTQNITQLSSTTPQEPDSNSTIDPLSYEGYWDEGVYYYRNPKNLIQGPAPSSMAETSPLFETENITPLPESTHRSIVGVFTRWGGYASGFFIDKNIVATNYHVVDSWRTGETEDAEFASGYWTKEKTIRVPGHGEVPVSSVLGVDRANDIALIKVPEVEGIVPLKLSTGPPNQPEGTLIRSLGYPKGLGTAPQFDVGRYEPRLVVIEDKTALYGQRAVPLTDPRVSTYDQPWDFELTEARGFKGESGSPVFDPKGNVLGQIFGGRFGDALVTSSRDIQRVLGHVRASGRLKDEEEDQFSSDADVVEMRDVTTELPEEPDISELTDTILNELDNRQRTLY